MQKLAKRRSIWIFTFVLVAVKLLMAKIMIAKLVARIFVKTVTKALALIAKPAVMKIFERWL